jgi:hypothetical protein
LMQDRFAELRSYLVEAAERGDQFVTLDFDQVDRMIGGLPGSAYSKKQWWANGRQPQAKAWLEAGWRVNTVGFYQKRVVFTRLS